MSSTPYSFAEVRRHGSTRVVWQIFGLSLVLVSIDFYLGPVLQFPVLFVLPVMWGAWERGVRFGCGLALALAISRFVCHWFWDFPLDFTPAVVNNLLRAVGLVLVGVITGRVAGIVRDLRRRIVFLEARLTVCEECGVIREEDGRWVPLEDGPAPTRGRVRCPRCEEKLYGSVG